MKALGHIMYESLIIISSNHHLQRKQEKNIYLDIFNFFYWSENKDLFFLCNLQ